MKKQAIKIKNDSKFQLTPEAVKKILSQRIFKSPHKHSFYTGNVNYTHRKIKLVVHCMKIERKRAEKHNYILINVKVHPFYEAQM